MISTKHKKDFILKNNKILEHKRIFSFDGESEDGSLPIMELSIRAYWYLFRKRLKGKLYLMVTPWIDKKTFTFDFFRILNKEKDDKYK